MAGASLKNQLSMDFLAFLQSSNQMEWENLVAEMIPDKVAYWTTLERLLLPLNVGGEETIPKKSY